MRLAKIAAFERRHALLQQFVLAAVSETALFEDARSVQVAPGVRIGPVIVSRDFVGSPIVRARVRNSGSQPVSLLLTAHLTNAASAADASLVLDLSAGESRAASLLCPQALVPAHISWSAVAL